MKKTIVANFKMNGSRDFIHSYFQDLAPHSPHQVIICPPFVYLDAVKHHLLSTNFTLGAQNCHEEEKGAHTGEISAPMLQDMGCGHVILGHSERRTHQGETNDLIQKKAQAALNAHLIPIICVGESLEQRTQGIAQDIIGTQLSQSLPLSGTFLIAYEPIWAIGTGLTATQEDIESMHTFIKNHPSCQGAPILYGGSVTAVNAQDILSYAHVDGVLVGGASLKPHDFNKIIG